MEDVPERVGHPVPGRHSGAGCGDAARQRHFYRGPGGGGGPPGGQQGAQGNICSNMSCQII